ncbi:hypothetical protein DSO57_1014522 [Entomophthora muscae]|uniref:Uncharacterized protein n=1 Tax=Entomophthora muscae TaxID=34485 RepID=A0ACC2T5V7_9FUNG|nr:hypothetical protein DSO57_1014522 [Entomophthora muscae]
MWILALISLSQLCFGQLPAEDLLTSCATRCAALSDYRLNSFCVLACMAYRSPQQSFTQIDQPTSSSVSSTPEVSSTQPPASREEQSSSQRTESDISSSTIYAPEPSQAEELQPTTYTLTPITPTSLTPESSKSVYFTVSSSTYLLAHTDYGSSAITPSLPIYPLGLIAAWQAFY